MEKIKKIISEIHLYNNKIEALIKVIIWIISWIGGIFVLLDTENKEVLCSAYFIYMLSLLMEFVPKIHRMKEFGSRIIHSIFCFIMAIIFLLAVGVLFGVSLPETGYDIMLNLTTVVIVYMAIDVFVLWLEPENKPLDIKSNDIDSIFESRETFSERLSNGNLGDINGGANNG